MSKARANALALASAFTAMDPKDSGGHLIYVTPRETRTRMERVLAAFNVYESSIKAVQEVSYRTRQTAILTISAKRKT